MPADAVTAPGSTDLSPTAPGLTTAAARGNLSPTVPAILQAVAGGNLSPTAPGLTTAAAGGNLSPTVPAILQAVAGGNLSPTTGLSQAAASATGQITKMVVSGITYPTAANGDYFSDGSVESDGKLIWKKSGYKIAMSGYGGIPGTICWGIIQDTEFLAVQYFRSVGRAATPALETTWTPGGGTGTVTVTQVTPQPTQGITANGGANLSPSAPGGIL